ncbi:hypothetical protein C5748_04700 [Phyllobacterium phragmitis]|uniref:Uncharacterized protein n=1 Tax=Phyllobacterium phragmitis TaxID=2670329 RepID=A0A2S9IW36_9HYPH|nr:hypothetical protein C5748_04700 [Phyllobacterium phragmitis]
MPFLTDPIRIVCADGASQVVMGHLMVNARDLAIRPLLGETFHDNMDCVSQAFWTLADTRIFPEKTAIYA